MQDENAKDIFSSRPREQVREDFRRLNEELFQARMSIAALTLRLQKAENYFLDRNLAIVEANQWKIICLDLRRGIDRRRRESGIVCPICLGMLAHRDDCLMGGLMDEKLRDSEGRESFMITILATIQFLRDMAHEYSPGYTVGEKIRIVKLYQVWKDHLLDREGEEVR